MKFLVLIAIGLFLSGCVVHNYPDTREHVIVTRPPVVYYPRPIRCYPEYVYVGHGRYVRQTRCY